jgi:hypothetical protein
MSNEGDRPKSCQLIVHATTLASGSDILAS